MHCRDVVLVLVVCGKFPVFQSTTILKQLTSESTSLASTVSISQPSYLSSNDGDDDDDDNNDNPGILLNPMDATQTTSRRNLAPLEIDASFNSTTVDFSAQSIAEINPVVLSASVPESGLYHLDLQNNSLTRILSIDFTYDVFNRMLALNLNNNFITRIDPGAFGSVDSSVHICVSLVALYLWDNRLSSLPDNFLSGTSITTLDLTENLFEELPRGVVGATRTSTKLRALSLARNRLTYLDLDGLGGLEFSQLILSDNLITFVAFTERTPIVNLIILLDVSANKLTALPTVFGCILNLYAENNVGITALGEFFCASADIQRNNESTNSTQPARSTLSPNTPTPPPPQCGSAVQSCRFVTFSVRGCSISSISSGIFRYALPEFVDELNFNDNSITIIETGAFACVPMMRKLILSENFLTRLDAAMFGNAQVQYLDVSFNRLTVLQKDQLPIPTSLFSFVADGNLITVISYHTFQRNETDNLNLVSIHLAKNRIVDIEAGALAGCSAVTDLNLAANQITRITRSMFDDLPRLSILNVAENLINAIDPETHLHVSGSLISHLDLSGNRLTMLSVPLTMIFCGARTLNLADNLITSIQPGALNQLISVVTLDLQLNEIASIRSQEFSAMAQLELLNLGSNRITMFSQTAFAGIKQLQRVVIRDNPIICDIYGLPNPSSQYPHEPLDAALVQCFGCHLNFHDDPAFPYVMGDGNVCRTGWGALQLGAPASFMPPMYSDPHDATVVMAPQQQHNWTVGQLYIVAAPNLTRVEYGGLNLVDVYENASWLELWEAASNSTGFNVPDYSIRFSAWNLPPGMAIKPRSGVISGVPLEPTNVVVQVYVSIAEYPKAQQLLHNLTFNVQYADTDNRSWDVYGPNGLPCMNGGVPVDTVAYDHHYTCDCPAPYIDANCMQRAYMNVTFGACVPHDNQLCWESRGSPWQFNATYHVQALNLTALAINGELLSLVHFQDVVFELVPPINGMFLDARTAGGVYVPTTPVDTPLHTTLYAVYNGTIKTAVRSLEFTVQYADTLNASNGPDGHFCENGGTAVDTIPFDHNFTCSCASKYKGVYCQEAIVSETVEEISFVLVGTAMFALALLFSCRHIRKSRIRKLQKEKVKEAAISGGTVEEHILWDAIHLQMLQQVIALVQNGARCDVRDPLHNKLPHVVVLEYLTPKRDEAVEVLQMMLRSHCEIDTVFGRLLADNKMALSITSQALTLLAKEGHRVAATNENVLHVVVNAHNNRILRGHVATQLVTDLLSGKPSLMLERDSNGCTPSDLVVNSNNMELQRLLTTFVFGRIQILHPDKWLHRSMTGASILYDCNLLRHSDAEPKVKCVVKLLRKESAWTQEVVYLDRTRDNHSIVSMLWAAAVTPDSPQRSDRLEVADCEYLAPVDRSTKELYTHRLGLDLMAEFPYAICLARADCNVGELIGRNMFVDTPMGALCYQMQHVARGLHELHANNKIVHGGVRPRNIVRSGRKPMQLVDLGSALPLVESSGVAAYVNSARSIPLEKLECCTAYLNPEVMACVRNRRDTLDMQTDSDADDTRSIDLSSFDLMQIDIWGFGATLYELVAGRPLVGKDVCDSASADGETALIEWGDGGGFDKRFMAPILLRHRCTRCPRGALPEETNRHRKIECEQVVELLSWIFDVNPRRRPDSMRDVLKHPFFSAPRSELSLSYHAEQLRTESFTPSFTVRKSVYISYCSRDSREFVLSRLGPRLAMDVEHLSVDVLDFSPGLGACMDPSVERSMSTADVVVAVVSPGYVANATCVDELRIAKDLNKQIIPVLYHFDPRAWPPSIAGDTGAVGIFRLNGDSAAQLPFVNLNPNVSFDNAYNFDLLRTLQQRPRELGNIQSCESTQVRNNILTETSFSPDTLIASDSTRLRSPSI
eukprot:m.1498211 g.1498211  ORF g.1498211 m.1498211 type:complete len:1885 (+) comp25202_c1_seq4:239-5893(+)